MIGVGGIRPGGSGIGRSVSGFAAIGVLISLDWGRYSAVDTLRSRFLSFLPSSSHVVKNKRREKENGDLTVTDEYLGTQDGEARQ